MNENKEALDKNAIDESWVFGWIAGSCFISMGIIYPVSIIFTSLNFPSNTSVHHVLLSLLFVFGGVSSIVGSLMRIIYSLASRIKKLEEQIKVNLEKGQQ
jgi:Ca2+/Na+ antiporter